MQVESPDFFQRGAYTASDKALRGKKSLATTDYHEAQFHFMVSISDEYKYKRLVKTTFKSCGKVIFLELYHTRN